MTAAKTKAFIETATGCHEIEMDEKGFHVAFEIMDILTEAQWNAIKAAKHDVTDKGIFFYA